MGSVLVIVAVQIWVVAFLADLQAASRRLLAEARVRDRVPRSDRAVRVQASSTRATGYQPRSIHSWRCGRSVPIVVSSPWPGSTIVSAGKREQLVVDRVG